MPRDGLASRLAAFTIALLALGLLSVHTTPPTSAAVVGAAAPGSAVTLGLPTTAPSSTAPPSAGPAPAPPAPVTTTTVAPPPPPPAPTTAPAPPVRHEHHAHPAPPPPTAPPAPAETLQERVERAYATGVPPMWRNAIHVELSVIDGRTSWAQGGGKIMIARSHAEARFEHLVDVVAHEFGHLIAFEFGTREYAGAAPEGWPAPANNPAEAWADCVQSVFTGRSNPSHGLAPCGGEQLSWAADWLRAVPQAASA